MSGGGGRLDHLLAAVAALVEPGADDPAVSVTAWLGAAYLAVLHGPGTLAVQGRPGELLTLLAIGGPAHGVRTTGLRYPLRDETLLPFSSRGVSNEFESDTASVSLTDGHLVVIRPEALEVPA